MENKKGYVVLEVGFEYNDEINHTGNYGATYEAPNKVFLSKEKAEAQVKIQTFEKLRGLDLGSYCYGLKEITKKGKMDILLGISEEMGIEIEEGGAIPEEATDEQLEKILNCITLEFFTMVEVELE